MRVVIEVSNGKHVGKHRMIRPGQSIKVGRSEWADFPCPWDRTMSAEHFQLRCDKVGCILADLDSRNGTFVNGQPVSEVLIADQDNIEAGETTFHVTLKGGAPEKASSTFDLSYADRPTDADVVRGFKGRLHGEFHVCDLSGWHKAWGNSEGVKPHVLAQLLKKGMLLYLVVDPRRSGITIPEPLEDRHYIFDALPPETAQHVSPLFLSVGNSPAWQPMAKEAWGNDGLIYILSKEPADAVLESLRAACRTTDPNSIVGFCWPSIASRLLELPDPAHQPALPGIAMLLFEQADDPETWVLYSRDDPAARLRAFGMKRVESPVEESADSEPMKATGGSAR